MSILDEMFDNGVLASNNYGLNERDHVLEVQSYGNWGNGEYDLTCSCGLLKLTVIPKLSAPRMHHREDVQNFINENGIEASLNEHSVYGDMETILSAILHHTDQHRVNDFFGLDENGEIEYDEKLATDETARYPEPYDPEKDVAIRTEEMNQAFAELSAKEGNAPDEINVAANKLAALSAQASAAVTRMQVYLDTEPMLSNPNFDEEIYTQWQELFNT